METPNGSSDLLSSTSPTAATSSVNNNKSDDDDDPSVRTRIKDALTTNQIEHDLQQKTNQIVADYANFVSEMDMIEDNLGLNNGSSHSADDEEYDNHHQQQQQQRPMQLPRVGWGDDEENTHANNTSHRHQPQDAPETLQIPPPKSKHRHGSSSQSESIILRTLSASRNNSDGMVDLAPIPEDYSLHGGAWPSYYPGFTDCYSYDYDEDRKKVYRYRMCGRLGTRRGLIVGVVIVALLGVMVSFYRESPTQQLQQPNLNSDAVNPTTSYHPPEHMKLTKEQSEMYEIISTSLHPLWFDRSSGWNGTAYLQAYQFCSSIGVNKRVPCPYTAYCPLGSAYIPLGGIKDEPNGSWAPVYNSPNAWVQVGSEGTCELYESRYGKPPMWGLTGEGDEEITRHVMCCLDAEDMDLPKLPDVNEESMASDLYSRPPSIEEDNPDSAPGSAGSDATSAAVDSSISKETPSETTTTTSEVPKVVDTHSKQQSSQTQQQSTEGVQIVDPDPLIGSYFEPVWFDRKHNWTGTTPEEGEEFCRTNAGNRSLCPYPAVCPKGPEGLPFGGIRGEKGMAQLSLWMPMLPWGNMGFQYVGVGPKNTCGYISDQSEFGDEEQYPESVTGFLMCCKVKDIQG